MHSRKATHARTHTRAHLHEDFALVLLCDILADRRLHHILLVRLSESVPKLNPKLKQITFCLSDSARASHREILLVHTSHSEILLAHIPTFCSSIFTWITFC